MILKVVIKSLSRCGECSQQQDRKAALEYADKCSEGSYHLPKVTEENVVPLVVLEGRGANPTMLSDNFCGVQSACCSWERKDLLEWVDRQPRHILDWLSDQLVCLDCWVLVQLVVL